MVIGNDNLRRLLDVLDRKGHKFPFDFCKSSGLRGVRDLRKIIDNEKRQGKTDTIDMYQKAFFDSEVQEILQLSLPSVKEPKFIDLTENLEIDNGRVYGLSLTELSQSESFKYVMVAGLFLMRLMTKGIPSEEMDTLVDCGVFNSAKATKGLAEHFGLKGEYYVPKTLDKVCMDLASDEFTIHHEFAKYREGGNKELKNACYKTLAKRLTKDKGFAARAIYLGHSELGWVAMLPIARRYTGIFEANGIKPDVLFSCIGAGTFFVPFVLEGFAKENYLGEYPECHPMTAEHKSDGLKVQSVEDISDFPMPELVGYSYERHKKARLNLSRKFEENPFIPDEFWDNISQYYFGGSLMDYKMLGYLKNKGVEVGMTSAGVIGVARQIAQNTRKTVVVPVFENKLIDYCN